MEALLPRCCLEKLLTNKEILFIFNYKLQEKENLHLVNYCSIRNVLNFTISVCDNVSSAQIDNCIENVTNYILALNVFETVLDMMNYHE